ncbi:MAG TPA: hypothetical protein VK151_04070 [Fluviicola sp.]|nr:hypothetical protein [Fluviicola sp.]
MKPATLLLFLLLFSNLFAQEKLRIVPITHYDYDKFDPTITIQDLFRDSIDCIELVSLSGYQSSRKGYYYERTIICPNGIDVSHLRIVRQLDTAKWQQLSTILALPAPQENMLSACYAPRNGIIFYSKSGEIVSYLELCFECNMNASSGIPLADPLINFSAEKYQQLKNLFNEIGMKIYEPR